MDEVREYTFEELCQIVGAIAAEYGILRVYLFGSRARGDNRPDSDYDFCVKTPKGMGLFKMPRRAWACSRWAGSMASWRRPLGQGLTSCARSPSAKTSADPFPRT